jgi:Alpha-glutamyl/putrescinyl thymine pyrophosphorylase clade 3
MRKEDLIFAKAMAKRLNAFDARVHPLPGIEDQDARSTFIFQIVESVRRIRFVQQVSQRPIAESRKDPATGYFDPVRAAILYEQAGEIDEASWLVFLFVHFGKNAKSGYRLIADIYGKLGQGGTWTWAQVSHDPIAFRHWLDKNQRNLKTWGKTHRAFGNHRKYQSLDAWKPVGTGEAVHTYTIWVTNSGGHGKLFSNALEVTDGDPEEAFAHLYTQMSAVKSFGRTAKFDYLAMIGKVGLAPIRPNSVHFDGATGPVIGARLLFSGKLKSGDSVKKLETLSDSLALHLQVDKQVIEDSLCNWQKSPAVPERFRG